MHIVKSIVIVVALSLAWVLATQDRVAVFDIGPTVDLPEMHLHSKHDQPSQSIVKSVVCKPACGVSSSGGDGSVAVIAVGPATIAPCRPSKAFVWSRLQDRPPCNWHRGNPATGPPVLA